MPNPSSLDAYRSIRNPTDLHVLHCIANEDQGVTTVTRIQEETRLDRTTIGHAVKRLEREELIESCKPPNSMQGSTGPPARGWRFKNGIHSVADALRREYEAHNDQLLAIRDWTLRTEPPDQRSREDSSGLAPDDGDVAEGS